MFDIGFWELAVVFIIALLIAGPERLPTMARMAGGYLARLRRFLQTVKTEVERDIREADAVGRKEVSRLEEDLGKGEMERARQDLESFRDSVERGDAATPAQPAASKPTAGGPAASEPTTGGHDGHSDDDGKDRES